MNRKLNPNAIPFTPQSTLTSTKHPHEWPPISRTDDPDEHETLEGIKRLSKWIDEWESSTNPNNQCQEIDKFYLTEIIPNNRDLPTSPEIRKPNKTAQQLGRRRKNKAPSVRNCYLRSTSDHQMPSLSPRQS